MPVTNFSLEDPFEYLAGFNAWHQTETAPGIIPQGTTFLQKGKYGVYPERVSGTSFTVPRKDSKQTFLYRLLPSTCHDEFIEAIDHPFNASFAHEALNFKPNQSMWAPIQITEEDDFVTGLRLIGGAGEPTMKKGVAYYAYTAGKSMPKNQAFDSADGDMCIVPQKGTLDIRTEMGNLRVRPYEICVVPRGIRFHVSLPDGPARGFILETFAGHFELPELGPIGSYGLANVRDFEVPKASFVDTDEDTELLSKFAGTLHRATYRGGIFNVAGWHGTYYPFKYDLGKFNAMGSISYDHPDPSIATVLTCASEVPGQAVADIVVFGPRWVVFENSFRPPRYHRNTMSEFIFLVKGSFGPEPMPAHLEGMFGLSNTMSAHGPSAATYDHATSEELVPQRIDEKNMGLMFESCYQIGTTKWVDTVPTKMAASPAGTANLQKVHIPE
ncbi:uncharacterized protein N7479_005363 [Penicillium vulpinum]|uniref:homogentisate 1,2-dioxygenase n=1 Tax=Penicillium vulpinum TaxID=29845 RepID=A0A1V6RK20_9EURO|nr:uncharacterized protein N7479_005363 [Penicillium vulpinum]KAJ5958213.1 hypothetical protein N7479_005363 [Penicillium vulpinum]OQE02182.1 hypothetical protein PENVUL_c040G09271 [Penicillium vulpinum]